MKAVLVLIAVLVAMLASAGPASAYDYLAPSKARCALKGKCLNSDNDVAALKVYSGHGGVSQWISYYRAADNTVFIQVSLWSGEGDGQAYLHCAISRKSNGYVTDKIGKDTEYIGSFCNAAWRSFKPFERWIGNPSMPASPS